MPDRIDERRKRELEHHDRLYAGEAQRLFGLPGPRAFRRHHVRRIVRLCELRSHHRILSLGCGIGDTELLLARYVESITGVDLSAKAIEQARSDAAAAGVRNVEFFEGDGSLIRGQYDAVLAIFFLHHLSDEELHEFPRRLLRWLRPEGVFYAIDPNRLRLSGAVGKVVIPKLMKKYQTEDERELDPRWLSERFETAGWSVRCSIYDFLSTPLAGVYPQSAAAYWVARGIDDVVTRIPLVRRLGSNFEIVARLSGKVAPVKPFPALEGC